MPLPFILGGLAVASVATGVKKGYDGYQDKEKADNTLKYAKEIFEESQKQLDTAQTECTDSLDKLGKLYLKIGHDFNEFQTLAEQLIEQIEKDGKTHLQFNVPQIAQAKIESVSLNSAAFASKMAGGAVAGVAAGYAVYGGVMSLAAASTGTAISSLSGVAAYNATLAAIGGGSIASGGFGMAVGAKILGGVVAAPVALVAGLAYASYGKDALEKAQKSFEEAKNYRTKATDAKHKLTATKSYVYKLEQKISIIHSQFQKYLDDLKVIEMMVRRGQQSELAGQSNILRVVENGYGLAAILADIITTPLFKVQKNQQGEIMLGDNKEPLLCKDSLGLHSLNHDEMNATLDEAEQKVNYFKK